MTMKPLKLIAEEENLTQSDKNAEKNLIKAIQYKPPLCRDEQAIRHNLLMNSGDKLTSGWKGGLPILDE